MALIAVNVRWNWSRNFPKPNEKPISNYWKLGWHWPFQSFHWFHWFQWFHWLPLFQVCLISQAMTIRFRRVHGGEERLVSSHRFICVGRLAMKTCVLLWLNFYVFSLRVKTITALSYLVIIPRGSGGKKKESSVVLVELFISYPPATF